MDPRLLLHRLERTAGDCSSVDEFSSAKVEDGMVICNELANFPDFRSCLTERAREWLCTELKEGDLTSGRDREALWLNGFSIHLAGLLEMEEQLERLLELLKYDWDWTNELIQKALCRLRSPGVLERCARLYPSMPWQGRLFSSSVFETACFPETETLVTGLLQAEPDDDQRVRLAHALAHCGTPQSQNIARAVYAEAPDDPERFDIVRLLYAQFAILGVKDAEMEEWQRTMKDTRLRLRDARARLAPVIHAGASGSAFTALLEACSEPKIGRNEMCPCGSAKKYKQCCLRR
jgi:hypothetical protein